MKLHAKHQRLCLLRPLDLNDLAGADGVASTTATALAVLFLFRVPSSLPSSLPGPLPGPLLIATSGATSSASSGDTSWANSWANS
jgi:hypothetical protein